MIYYVNVTSWNLLESFVTESISPHAFYRARSFGNNLSRFLDSSNELGNFLILSTRDTQGDYSIQIDESLIDVNQLEPIKGYETLFTYNRTIYYKRDFVSFRFSNQDLLDALLAESHILFEVKCVDKYRNNFYVKEVRTHSVDVATKLSKRNGFSFTLNECVETDNLFDVVKGAIIGYARGILTTSNGAEQTLKSSLIELKNSFAGLNTNIMVRGLAVPNVDEITSNIQKCKISYNKLRDIKTNQFDILLHQFNEIISIAELRAKALSSLSRDNSINQIASLKERKDELETEIYKIELSNNIVSLKDELQAIKDQERINGQIAGKTREYFKKGSNEYERKMTLKSAISTFEATHTEYKGLLGEIQEINLRISDLSTNSTEYDNAIQSIFARISDIINDLIKKVNDSESLNSVDLRTIYVSPSGEIRVRANCGSDAEIEYFNTALNYLIKHPTTEPISDARILDIIVETAKIYKGQTVAASKDGAAILSCLRDFWCYKNQRISTFMIPDDMPIIQSIMAFFVKPFGYDQIERYILNKRYSEKAYAFMLWGACLGFAAIPKTFTSILYQEKSVSDDVDNFLLSVNHQLRTV
jgi:hypothetical protein